MIVVLCSCAPVQQIEGGFTQKIEYNAIHVPVGYLNFVMNLLMNLRSPINISHITLIIHFQDSNRDVIRAHPGVTSHVARCALPVPHPAQQLRGEKF